MIQHNILIIIAEKTLNDVNSQFRGDGSFDLDKTDFCVCEKKKKK